MKFNQSKVTVSVELDENLYECIQNFLTINKEWDFDTTINAGMCLFLLQNYRQSKGLDDPTCSQNYLHSMYKKGNKASQN